MNPVSSLLMKLTSGLQHYPIKFKLVIISLSVAGVTLLLASIAFTLFQIDTYRNRIVDNSVTLAKLVGVYSTPALQASDKTLLESSLAELAQNEGIQAIVIFDQGRQLFAAYGLPEGQEPELVSSEQQQELDTNGFLSHFHNYALHVDVPIRSNQQMLGYVQIQAGLQALQRQIVNFTLVLMTVLLVAVFVGYGLISVLQRIITEPLEVFRKTVEEVRLHKKFNSRVEIHSKDELGALASGFNEMLSEIKRRDERLDQYRTSLEKNVQERTVDIQNAYKALENALKNVTDSKSKVEKVSEEKTQIIAEIGKEIRTPMNTIMGMTALLLDGELNQEQKQYARSTQASAESLMQLVNKLIRNALGDEGETGDARQQAAVTPTPEATLVSGGGDTQTEPVAMHVLVVEDNHLNRQVIELFVKKAGCTLKSVEHGQQAVELAATHKFDLIFMDCYMPIMDGFEATRRIRAQGQLNARAPIVALTAHVQRGDRETAFAAGMSDYLEKPIKFEQVYLLLKKYKGGATPAATASADNKPTVVVREAAPVLDKSELADLKMATGAQFQVELAKLITTFEGMAVESLAGIRKAAAQRDWKALYAVSHSLAGATGSVGGKRMAALCRQLMAAAGKENAEVTEFCVEQLETEYEALHAALRLQQLNSAAG